MKRSRIPHGTGRQGDEGIAWVEVLILTALRKLFQGHLVRSLWQVRKESDHINSGIADAGVFWLGVGRIVVGD
jgi:hypothetical protein